MLASSYTIGCLTALKKVNLVNRMESNDVEISYRTINVQLNEIHDFVVTSIKRTEEVIMLLIFLPISKLCYLTKFVHLPEMILDADAWTNVSKCVHLS